MAGKKRFREIRTNLGLDLYNYKAQDDGADQKAIKLQFPFRRTFDPNASNKKSDQLWN